MRTGWVWSTLCAEITKPSSHAHVYHWQLHVTQQCVVKSIVFTIFLVGGRGGICGKKWGWVEWFLKWGADQRPENWISGGREGVVYLEKSGAERSDFWSGGRQKAWKQDKWGEGRGGIFGKKWGQPPAPPPLPAPTGLTGKWAISDRQFSWCWEPIH